MMLFQNLGSKLQQLPINLVFQGGGFYKKLNNETEFKASEISAMQKILGLTNRKRDEIFFAQKVELKST